MLYRLLLRPFFFLLDAERAHHVGFGLLRFAAKFPGGALLLSWVYAYRSPRTEVKALGLLFPTPIGLAAGFDKDARGFEALGALGFGHVEVGTLTGQAQPGNPQPRLFRLPADRALINRMGFNNGGSAGAIGRLSGKRRGVVGVNIGKTKVVPEERAVEDYVASTERLARFADYFVVNVSSPNTPGLRDLQAVDKLRPILEGVRAALDESSPKRRVPLLVKIAPDLADEDVDAVAELALELGLDGIVATNTTISRAGLASDPSVVEAMGNGGLSGAPLRDRSRDVIRRLRARVGDRLVLIAAGGVDSAEEAWQRIKSGATLVQIYTAFIYGGPGLPGMIAEGVDRLAAAEGYARVQDAIGVDVDAK